MNNPLLNRAENATLNLKQTINEGASISCYQTEILGLMEKICVFLKSKSLPNKERISTLVGSIGYLITDDDDFADTTIGEEIIEIVNEFAEIETNE